MIHKASKNFSYQIKLLTHSKKHPRMVEGYTLYGLVYILLGNMTTKIPYKDKRIKDSQIIETS